MERNKLSELLRPLRFLPALAAALRDCDAPIIVTGASGWLGRATLDMLDSALGPAFENRVTAFTAQPKQLPRRAGKTCQSHAYTELAQWQTSPAYTFHFAFRTRGYAAEPGYIATNREISRIMQDFITRNGALGMLLPSSGAVYAPDRTLDTDIEKNPYGVLKHEDEIIFNRLASDQNFTLAIPRIFNLAGPFINNLSGYALSCIITDIASGGPITLHAPHPVWRSYTHIEDLLNIATALILRGQNLPPFDTAGEKIEISALAERAAKLLAPSRTIQILRPACQAQKPDNYLGKPDAYTDAARFAGVTLQGLDAQIQNTAAYMLLPMRIDA